MTDKPDPVDKPALLHREESTTPSPEETATRPREAVSRRDLDASPRHVRAGCRVEVDELLDVREAVVARMRQSARGKASGAPVEVLLGVVFRFRDRQIAQMEFFRTDADALKAVGLEG